MLKSDMEFVDVIFPLNIGPLTYKCPAYLIEKAMPGMLVSAPLKKKIEKGIISGISRNRVSGEIRSITEIHGDSQLLEPGLLKLLDWMADYYIANHGLILKNMLPKEAFKKVRARKSQKSEGSRQKTEDRPLVKINEEILLQINESISKKEYRTFLLHAPSSSFEISALAEILKLQRNAIVLVPEIIHANHIEPFIRTIAGEKLCVFHSGLSRGQRSDAIEKITSGECSVVLGTRTAIFAPLKNVSFIALMQEHSGSYKTEEGLRYNARDIAVMRGFLEKTTVLLSSICPSIESIHNVRQRKYTLLKPDADIRRPKIRIVDMRAEKQLAPNLSKTILDAAKLSIVREDRVMFVINRKGYSMLTCAECNYTETCKECGIPLVFHKDDRTLRCHYCASKSLPPEKCSKCGSYKIELSGTGIQRVEENIKKLLNIEPVRFDSDKIKTAIFEDLSETIKEKTIVLGTKLLTKRLHIAGDFSVGAILNADIYLNQPDFRAAENAYQEISAIADRIKADGRLFIHTRMPHNDLFRFIRNYDYSGFCEEELLRRKAASFPPYSKLALITIKVKDSNDKKLRADIERFISENLPLANEGQRGVLEILGPSLSPGKKGQKGYAMLVKATSKARPQPFVKEFLRIFEGYKNLKVSVAVDP